MKAYVAAGWFTKEQELARQAILDILHHVEIDYYSPKDDMLYVPGETDPQFVFETNIREITASSLVIASTEGKDMGTIFECGVAYYIGRPLVYYWTGPGSFNLMLSQSATYVATTYHGLLQYLTMLKCNGQSFLHKKYGWKGEIE